jgi:signal transduction histidine kinase
MNDEMAGVVACGAAGASDGVADEVTMGVDIEAGAKGWLVKYCPRTILQHPMDTVAGTPALPAVVASRLRNSRAELTEHWLARINERVALSPDRVFPTDDLLDHVPLLLLGIADHIEDPARTVAADSNVVAKAMELGELRHNQGFTEYEILKEFEIFGGILFSFLTKLADELDGEPAAWTLCAMRLFQAVALLQQATATRYLQIMSARVREREDRLRAFDRALTHEMGNRIGAVLGASQLLEALDLSDDDRRRLASVVARNASGMRVVLENLLELSKVGTVRQHRHVLLPQAAAEAVRQLREMAQAEGIDVMVDDDLPAVEVNSAAIELVLANLVSNAIKYSDPTQPRRWVRVSATHDGAAEVVVTVRDNGLGVPESGRQRLFERFYRAHAGNAVDGTGLGLSIVREAIHDLGGRVWVEFPDDGGSAFIFTIPARRVTDAQSALAT